MSYDLITSKIELLQAQIDNLEKSGFFTEQEMDSISGPLRMELATLNLTLGNSNLSDVLNSSQSIVEKFTTIVNSFFSPTPEMYGMSEESYKVGIEKHKQCFSQLATLKNLEA